MSPATCALLLGFLGALPWVLLDADGATMSSDDKAVAGTRPGYELWYSAQESEQEFNSLLIEEDGTVSANVEFAGIGYPLRGLGAYQIKVDVSDPDLRRIGELMRAGRLIGGDIYAHPPTFGGQSVYFRFRSGGAESFHDLDAALPLPEPFREIETIVERLLVRTAASPFRALTIAVAIEPSPVTAGKSSRITVEFRNPGKSAVAFRNPAHTSGPSVGSLQVHFWRSVRESSGEVVQEREATIDLRGKELLSAPRRAVSSRDATLSLEPGATFRAWTTTRFPRMEPGPYSVEVVYYGSPRIGEELKGGTLIVGEYHSDLVPVDVVP